MNPVTIGSTRHQPPAEAQAQGGGEVCIRCGDKPDSADYTDPLTLRGLIEYVRVAADPHQGAKRWHALNLLKQALPHLKRLEEMTAPTSAPVGVEGLMQLARNWCLAWGEWAHDADPGCAKENAAEAALRAALTQALSQQPAACPKCGGTGEADSGGIMPWGAPAMIPCDCQQPAADALGAVRETCPPWGTPQACDFLLARALKAESALAQAPASGEAVAPFGYCADFETGLYECSHKFYYLAPGQPVPEGCTPFYTTPPAPVPAVRVTERMVRTACVAHDPMYDHCSSDTRADMHRRMRAALEAVLGQEKANG